MSYTEKGLRTREIITKAVCGKGSKFSQDTHVITPAHAPTSILGCWVINHSYDAKKAGDAVEVAGSYDINVWYSYANNTKTEVAKESVSYVDRISLSYLDGNLQGSDHDVHAKVIQQPNAVEAKISGSKCRVVVEREFYCEMVGETKVCVVVAPGHCGEMDDKFDDDSQDYEQLDEDILVDDLD